MRGFVPTPNALVDRMVQKLFTGHPPERGSSLLDPGCGEGVFLEGAVRWCRRHGTPLPDMVGVEANHQLARQARQRLKQLPRVRVEVADFLAWDGRAFDYVIGNPPYVPITGISPEERTRYAARFTTARGRFDLYILFFEKALSQLGPQGRLVFVTPEKFTYVESAEILRRLLTARGVEEIHLVEEDAFGDLVTYPAITTVSGGFLGKRTRALSRDGGKRRVQLPTDGRSWLPALRGEVPGGQDVATLETVCSRVSCGVATGADEVFVHPDEQIPPQLRRFAYPTISGRDLPSNEEDFHVNQAMLVPYERDGRLLDLDRMGALAAYLSKPDVRRQLLRRTCVARKPWYSFHENPPLQELLRPKILCKDIAARPHFWVDHDGSLVPRHSVYYIIPKDRGQLYSLAEFLNSPAAARWLEAHCQRAANGFLRLQSRILKQLPVPIELVRGARLLDKPRPLVTPSISVEA